MPHNERLDDAHEWIRYAEADLALAEIDLPANALYEHLCFHAQQTAEKAIKAVLIAEGVTFPKSHNIDFLLTLLPPTVERTNLPFNAYMLTGYATIFRYPGEEEPVTESEYQQLLSIARGVLAWAKTYLSSLESGAT